MFEFRGNAWEYQKGSYHYHIMRGISILYNIQKNVFLPEMLSIVIFAAENDEL